MYYTNRKTEHVELISSHMCKVSLRTSNSPLCHTLFPTLLYFIIVCVERFYLEITTNGALSHKEKWCTFFNNSKIMMFTFIIIFNYF